REYSATYAALNDALPAMVDRGRGVAADFPLHFRSRCLKFPTFLTAANEELSAWLTRNQYECRLGESRSAVCRQYSQVAEILTRASLELSSELTPDTRRQRLLQQYLLGHDLDGETAAFYDESGLLRMELEGRSLDVLAKSPHPAALAKLLSLPLRPATVTKTPRGTRVVFLQAPPLAAQTALAARPKDGETVSGDGGTFLLLENGTLYALLCDGMGAGEGAHRESALALHLLEQFLKAGVDTEAALKTLNSALALRWEAEGGFTTVDLLRLDLVRGEGCIYKYGAAPSYLLCGGTVSRLSGSALPAGLLTGEDTAPDRLPFQVSPGDRIVLLSDGISAEEDSWLREALTGGSFAEPKALAQLIVTRPQPGTPSDDKTALVVFLQGK
ncbi:MAG: SpoIIE family protein phosphatase, partial [Oscillospiraceae bacterium]